MAGLLRHLAVEKAVIGGLSRGGDISPAFRMHHPEMLRALIAFDTGPGFRHPESLRAWNARAERRARDPETQGAAALGSPRAIRAIGPRRRRRCTAASTGWCAPRAGCWPRRMRG